MLHRAAPVLVNESTAFIGKVALSGMPAGTRIHYRARFERSSSRPSPWSLGSLKTAPTQADQDVLIAWSGDTNGQGFGIDPAQGGMPAYAALLAREPDIFVHVGDAIYADNPIPAFIERPEGKWNNLVDPIKDHVAETLEDFRGAHLYARASAEVRAASAAIPLFHIWDDHEVHNNWFPGEVLTDDLRYLKEKRVDVLAVHARRAMYECTPTLRDPAAGAPLYRVVNWGPLVDVFLLDGRSYRSPNEPPNDSGMLGSTQAAWLLDALSKSKAVWKIIACDMPIGVVVWEPGRTIKQANDGWANENGPPMEREIELSKLLAGMKARGVKNVVWVTADVHYCAVHRFDPAKAIFKDFDPFYELIAGPMHALTLPRKANDDTFGPEVLWCSSGWDTFDSPITGAQHFGLLKIDAATRSLRVSFVNARGRNLHELTLPPA